ncbi:MAG: hypothetical protein UW68_C0016G0014 [Candidatus Collierbacteria bacterium GW2011_GWB1_44_6]|uniref:tRNA carboxymethyluridine synthase n=2 Tax=Candidatus Collieribacteriota TaxID=1752725 RepID=A0A0G1MMC2_9BACT|nr:MAG: hypothetical protein UV68_C0017G0019 [Candidatus Collierbacteria bacterium GW2011_GWC2_43_12]KKT73134.1 MAG: hypothetical protein UW68_C0016G0014 [Candidatus Collierbacteria bacterium GW2011_GWB1_44_6]KKT82971.1 MAG: hat, histone acetyltransferase, elongator complex protein 3 [Microgenomates group bacterium GW2011_GWC1_44_9]
MSIEELVRRDGEKITPENLEEYRRSWAKVLGRMPKNSEIWPFIEDEEIKEMYKTRSVRTESGVAPFAVMMKPHYCPGNCVYCPLEQGMPKSYLSDEPAAQRAKKLKFDSRLQVEMRLKQLEETGHVTDKIDLIVIGGTFSAYPDDYKLEFFKGMFDGVNGFVSDSLESAQKFNESGKRRIVGISVETRPDWVTEQEIILWRKMGVTKVQLGVQAFDEQILRKIERGHDLDAVGEATRMCRNAGIKICYHFMPNLPGSSPEKDMEMARVMFADPRFQPDYLKVYPAMVIPDTELFNMWKRGEYESYTEEDLKKVLKEVKRLTPKWCRIDRLVRDISKQWVSSGTLRTNMRQQLQEELKKEGKKCLCIRCREVRAGIYDAKVELKMDERETLGGKELFMSYENDENLFSMLRLRLPDKGEKMLFPELVGAAIIREVHTYGQVKDLQGQALQEGKSQHRGLGKRLMAKAEEIAKERGYEKMAVISAIGTREYYKKLGYALEGEYMVIDLSE